MRALLVTAAATALALRTAPAVADERGGLQERVATVLREAGPGTRFGLTVIDDAGREIVAIAPDDRFVPASTTKLFTTAAAFDTLGNLAQPDTQAGATVRLDGRDVILEGHGDARLSSAADCVTDCLAALADAVAARTRIVRNIVGDDSWFPDQRWSPGMSWNNIATRSGTGSSALTLDDNELRVTVTPAPAGRGAAGIDAAEYYQIDNRVTTGGRASLRYDRLPGSRLLRIEGSVVATQTLRVGIDDPANYAAWRLRSLLAARGVRVTGHVQTRHRAASTADDPQSRGAAPAARAPRPPPLARAVPLPLIDDIAVTNTVSQNLHAELLLRRIGRVTGSGSIADGQARVTAMLTRAGVERWRYDLADGSGMSSYNRVTPRGTARFLRWTQMQAWGAAWRATLPTGSVGGTLRHRFVRTPLAGKIWAKSGTLNAATGLAGFMTAASGRTLTFASYANDMPADGPANAQLDAALVLIAASQ